MNEDTKQPKELADLIVALYKMRHGKDEDAFAKDCLKAVQKVMPTATKMTREPFGFIYDTDGKVYYSVVNTTSEKMVVETYLVGIKEEKK